MKNKRKILILAIVVITIIAILIAILYISTDLFKSNEMLFKKYLQKTDMFDEKIFTAYADALNKEIDNSNSSTTNLSIYDESLPIYTAKIDSLKNVNLSQDYSAIRISNDKKELAVLKTVRDGDIYAIGADNILTKYISLDINNLETFCNKIGISNTESIPNVSKDIDLADTLKIDETTQKNLSKKYLNIVFDNIEKNDYSKIKNEDKTITLNLELDNAKLKNVFDKIIEEAKNDNTLLNLIQTKLNSIGYEFSTEDIQNNIADMQQEINDYITSIEKSKVSLTVKNKETIKLAFEVKEVDNEVTNLIEFNFEEENKILTNINVDNMQYYITTEYMYSNENITTKIQITIADTMSYYFNIDVNNYNTDNFTENFEMGTVINEEKEKLYEINRNIELKQDIQIEKLTTENSVRIDNFDQKQVSTLINGIYNRILTLYGNELKNLEGLI